MPDSPFVKQARQLESSLALLRRLAERGGKVVCLASLPVEDQYIARAANNVFVDAEGMAFAWCKEEGPVASTASDKPWRRYVDSLTPEQRDKMLLALLTWQIEWMGIDGDVRFREADEDGPADIYWESCGDSVLDTRIK